MKRYIIYIVSVIVAVFTSNTANAASWTGTQTEGEFTLDADVYVTEPVKMTGNLTITVGAASHKIQAAKDMACIFWVYQGQTLTIKGEQGKKIIIDGGADFNVSFSSGMTSFNPNDITGVKLEEAIFSRGEIELQYVTIRNVNAYLNNDKDGGAICIKGKIDGGKSLGQTVLNHCTIYNSATENGSAIYFTCENEFDKSADECAVKLIDSEIYNCFSSGTYAGTIRSTGKAKSNLILQNTTIRDNFSNGAGGAVYWNGAGTDDTICSIDGCTFSGNVAGDMGGALMLETTFEIVKTNTQKNTVISGNRVFREEGYIDDLPRGIGGGMIIPSYTGQFIAPKNLHEFDYALSSNLEVTNNYAPVGGAGVAFAFAWFDVSSAKDENIDLDITLNGATISGNETAGNGAGIYVWNNTSQWNSKNTGKIDIKINLNKGTLSNNKAVNGAGIYSYHADIKHTAESSDLLTISGNTSSGYGGGIYVDGGSEIELAQTTFTSNSASNGGALAISESDADLSIVLGKATLESNTASENGGAIYMPSGILRIEDPIIKTNNAGNNGGAVYLDGGNLITSGTATVEGNYSSKLGGAFYVNNGTVKLANPSIKSNGKVNSSVRTEDGGAIYVTGDGAGFTSTGTTLLELNAATKNGGAIYVDGGNVNLSENTTIDNEASSGGAIYLKNGSLIVSGNSRVESNTATSDGGAFYVNAGNINLNGSATLSGNISNGNGGVAYVNNGSISTSTNVDETTTIQNNEAANGGAFYVTNGNITTGKGTISSNTGTINGGAFYLNEGEVSLGETIMSDNEATNGGAISLLNGEFTINAKSRIMNNSATYGGGLFVNNNSGTLTCNGGSFIGNNATWGGGIYATGNITLVLAANVQQNVARNGGGIYVDGGVKLEFGDGLIVGNRATKDGSNTGIGGGIYMNNANLSFTNTQNFGIYNNSAEYEAADIYASGSNTKIELPNVKTMDLKGFDVPGSELYWVYDNNGQRYEDALWDLSIDVEGLILDFGGASQQIITNKKICLDLGYHLVFVTLVASGLDKDDHTEIEMCYPKTTQGGTEKVLYRTVLFTGVEEDDAKIVIGIPSGNWYLEGTDLGLKYNAPTITPPNGFNDDDSINITREKNSTIHLAYATISGPAQHAVIYTKSLPNKLVPGGGN